MKVFRFLATRGLIAGGAFDAFGQQPKRVDNTALRNAAKNGDEWLSYGRDYAETHYSPLKQIDTSNVSRLGLSWSWETEAREGGGLEATPLMSKECSMEPSRGM